MNYEKILKWSLIGMLVLGALLTVICFVMGWPTKEEALNPNTHAPVNLLLGAAYAFAAITLVTVVGGVIVNGVNNPKSLIKMGIAAVVAVVLVLVAYLLAPGTQPLGYLGEPVEKSTLMMTDTMLNLAYFLLFGTLAAIIGWIINLIRK